MIPLLTSMDPIDDLLWGVGGLRREMDWWLTTGYPRYAAEFPAVNVWSNENEAVITAELPGMDAKDVNISVIGHAVTLEGERKPDEPGKNEAYQLQERGFGRFSRTIRLPYEVEADKVSASYKRGILEVKLPRHKATRPRKITVTGA